MASTCPTCGIASVEGPRDTRVPVVVGELLELLKMYAGGSAVSPDHTALALIRRIEETGE